MKKMMKKITIISILSIIFILSTNILVFADEIVPEIYNGPAFVQSSAEAATLIPIAISIALVIVVLIIILIVNKKENRKEEKEENK